MQPSSYLVDFTYLHGKDLKEKWCSRSGLQREQFEIFNACTTRHLIPSCANGSTVCLHTDSLHLYNIRHGEMNGPVLEEHSTLLASSIKQHSGWGCIKQSDLMDLLKHYGKKQWSVLVWLKCRIWRWRMCRSRLIELVNIQLKISPF